jgi:hypothetical protein
MHTGAICFFLRFVDKGLLLGKRIKCAILSLSFLMEALHIISHPDSGANSRLRLFEKRMLGRIFGPQNK